jgi:hypothetical protein
MRTKKVEYYCINLLVRYDKSAEVNVDFPCVVYKFSSTVLIIILYSY